MYQTYLENINTNLEQANSGYIRTIQQIMEKRYKYKKYPHLVFMDFKHAHGSINK